MTTLRVALGWTLMAVSCSACVWWVAYTRYCQEVPSAWLWITGCYTGMAAAAWFRVVLREGNGDNS
jgi:hypothetical protein